MPKSMMSSPRLRAAAFSSPVMLNTYAGSRVSLLNSSMRRLVLPVSDSDALRIYFAVKTTFTGTVRGG